ncbi:hypothetical protein [Massilia brevitalea]|uniref:hypothetical protein n=1 Tax=Massilia brevitalea TaxID=442526 RepID=UPI002738F9B9|nr:hypothetical protein [Massilia brevitalea]
MRPIMLACALGALLLANPAAAVPGVDEPDTVKVNAIRNPEIHTYKAVLAGLDSFDQHHALAPNVPELRFRIRPRGGAGLPEQPRVRIEGDHDFVLPLDLDAANRFSVPRSEAAEHENGEVVLNQKRKLYRIHPDVRTPGLPANVRRLGDLRLECKTMIAIAKEEIPLFWVVAINGLLLTRDWCNFTHKKAMPDWGFDSDAPIVGAILQEGKRSKLLTTSGDRFSVALGDMSWGDDALVELEFAPAPTN